MDDGARTTDDASHLMSGVEVLRVLDRLAALGISTVVSGGWGVDALLGRQTRPHGDLDVAVPAELLETAISALRGTGYRITLDARPARVVVAGPRGTVDLHPVQWDASGRGVQQGTASHVFVYPANDVSARGTIEGRPIRVISSRLQRAFHAGYELGDRDRHDLRVLDRLGDVAGRRQPEPET